MQFWGSINTLSEEEFQNIRLIVYNTTGINLTKRKRSFVVSRIYKRMLELGLDSYSQYLELLERNPEETNIMFNYLTTNVTGFFREKYHFKYLSNEYLPKISSEKKEINIWSAGCSTGKEPYTIAMVLHKYLEKSNCKINILASDINTDVLKKATVGIYTKEEIKGVPYEYLKKYFKLGIGANTGLFKVKKILRDMINFHRINLASNMEYPKNILFDIIFCRNVFIYFDYVTRKNILRQFYKRLSCGGMLFLGHSESIKDDKNWCVIKHTIYKRL